MNNIITLLLPPSGFANDLFIIGNYISNNRIGENPIFFGNLNKNTMILFDKLDVKYVNAFIPFDWDYKQDFSQINIDKIRDFFKIPDEIKRDILDKIPDIEDRVVIHVRRTDYINTDPIFISPSKEYIERTYKKYYSNEKVIIISDDIQWCKVNLVDLTDDIIFSDGNTLFDFYLLTMSKANICSASSYSMFGSYLNKNEDCVIPYPYFKPVNFNGRSSEEWVILGEKIIPNWAKREND